MRKLLTRYQPDLVFLFETHVRIESSGQFWQRIGYGAIGVEEVQGRAGGDGGGAIACCGGGGENNEGAQGCGGGRGGGAVELVLFVREREGAR